MCLRFWSSRWSCYSCSNYAGGIVSVTVWFYTRIYRLYSCHLKSVPASPFNLTLVTEDKHQFSRQIWIYTVNHIFCHSLESNLMLKVVPQVAFIQVQICIIKPWSGWKCQCWNLTGWYPCMWYIPGLEWSAVAVQLHAHWVVAWLGHIKLIF